MNNEMFIQRLSTIRNDLQNYGIEICDFDSCLRSYINEFAINFERYFILDIYELCGQKSKIKKLIRQNLISGDKFLEIDLYDMKNVHEIIKEIENIHFNIIETMFISNRGIQLDNGIKTIVPVIYNEKDYEKIKSRLGDSFCKKIYCFEDKNVFYYDKIKCKNENTFISLQHGTKVYFKKDDFKYLGYVHSKSKSNGTINVSYIVKNKTEIISISVNDIIYSFSTHIKINDKFHNKLKNMNDSQITGFLNDVEFGRETILLTSEGHIIGDKNSFIINNYKIIDKILHYTDENKNLYHVNLKTSILCN